MSEQITREDKPYRQHVPVRELKERSRNAKMLLVEEAYNAQSGHPASSLSPMDVMIELLLDEMNWKYGKQYADRDRFILSKGHGAPGYYAALAEAGYIPKEELKTLRRIDSRLQGHPWRVFMPEYIATTSGALAQGLSVGLGMAKYFRQHKKNNRVYVITGDGELDEGQNWEAAMSGGNYGYNNIVGIVDRNGFQGDGAVSSIMPTEPLDKKFEAFGWNTINVDGHDFYQLQKALDEARETIERPTMIIAKTEKGRIGPREYFQIKTHHPKAITETEYSEAINYLRNMNLDE